jgi:Flp pilus assembly protein protease CpaA
MSGGYEIVLWVLLIVASATDLLWGKIYNHLTLSSIALGIIARLYLGGIPSLTESLIGTTVAFILFFPLYYFKVFAAGDVKLLMAIGTWSNYQLVLRLSLVAILLGALVGIWVLLKKQRTEKKQLTRMPFGPAFLCSFLFLKIAEFKGWSLF